MGICLDMSFDPATLTPDERRQLYDQLAYEFRGLNSKGVAVMVERELYDDLCEALGTEVRHRMSLAKFVESYGRAKYEACAEQLNALVRLAVPKGTRRPVVMAVRRCILDCLISHLKGRGIPVTPKVSLNAFVMLRHAVEQAYPGYIDAKMLHRVAELIAA